MDPGIAWFPPEQLGLAHDLWTRVWEIQDNMILGSTPDQKQQDFIALPGNDDATKNDVHKMQLLLQKRKRADNRACTYGLSFSVNSRTLENDGLTPWKKPNKSYGHGIIG